MQVATIGTYQVDNGCQDNFLLANGIKSCQMVSSGLYVIASKITFAAQIFFDAAAKIKDSPGALGKACKLGNHVIVLLQSANEQWQKLAGLRHQLNVVDNLIDCFGFFGDLDYFINGKYKNEDQSVNKLNFSANLAFLFADFGGLIMWADELQMLDQLGHLSAMIGSTFSIGGTVVLSLTNIVNGFAVIGFGFVGANAIYLLIYAQNKEQTIHALLELAWSATEIAFKILLVTAAVNVPVLAVLGGIAVSFGITAFLYEAYHKKQLEGDQTMIAKDERIMEGEKL